jgi:hypothetical protein
MEAEERVAANEEERGGNFFVRWGLITLSLLVLYVLSIGPFAKLDQRGIIPPYVGRVLYGPLLHAAEWVPGGREFLNWYIAGVWRVR